MNKYWKAWKHALGSFDITTGKSLHHYTDDEFFLNNVKCIGWDDLCKMLDNNKGFWKKAEDIIKQL